MKKILLVSLFAILIFVTGCAKQTVKVEFVSAEGNIFVKNIDKNTKIAQPEDPVIEHKFFIGWFQDKEMNIPFDFNKNIEKDTTVYAKLDDIIYGIIVKLHNPYEGQYVEIKARFGETLIMPEDPQKDGYVFDGWYFDDGLKQEKFTQTTMPSGVGRNHRNDMHLPVFGFADFSRGIKDKEGNVTPYSQEKLQENYVLNLSTLEGRYRGNTSFSMSVNKKNDKVVATYTRNGFVYDRRAALYIQENSLATVSGLEFEDRISYQISNISDELLYGYNVHLNCNASPVTTNPFMTPWDYTMLVTTYYSKDVDKQQYVYKTDYRTFNATYDLLYDVKPTAYAYYFNETVYDENDLPIMTGGYHATDKNGKFLYDKNNQPVRSTEKFRPASNEYPFYILELYPEFKPL